MHARTIMQRLQFSVLVAEFVNILHGFVPFADERILCAAKIECSTIFAFFDEIFFLVVVDFSMNF